ncbi:MAG: hypothetical protein ACOCQZ_02385 [Halanaerobium sp.]
MLQFIFLFIFFLIFSTLLLLILPYTYTLSFNFQQKLEYSLLLKFLIFKFRFTGDQKKQSLFIDVLGFKKEFDLAENKFEKFIADKSSKIIEEKIKQVKSKKDKKKNKKKSRFKFDFKLISRENLEHLFKFILQMLKSLKPDYLKLKVFFSFADPYYNGLFLAYYYTLKELISYPDFEAHISWQEVVIEARGAAGGKIIPAKIIFQILMFLLSIKSLKIFWQLYQSNSKKG